MDKLDLVFAGKYCISADLCAVTGLLIGGSSEEIEIGGIDKTVIKDTITEHPYITGSSLKGKMRHLLEWSLGKIQPSTKHTRGGKPAYTAHSCGKCNACILFGVSADENKELNGPTRLTVRDSFPTEETLSNWERWLGNNVTTELKTENNIDRVTSEATPRTFGRVPAGSKFAVELIFDVYRPSSDKELLKNLFSSMQLLEDSTLGGSGSRGSGRVRFDSIKVEWRPTKGYYLDGGKAQSVAIPGTIAEIVGQFDKIDWKLEAVAEASKVEQEGNQKCRLTRQL